MSSIFLSKHVDDLGPRFREIKNGSCRRVRTKVANLLSLKCKDQNFLGHLDRYIDHVCDHLDANLVNTMGPSGSVDLLRVYYGRLGVSTDTESTEEDMVITEERRPSSRLKRCIEELAFSTRLALRDAIFFIRATFEEIKLQEMGGCVPIDRGSRPYRSLEDWIVLLTAFLERM